MLCAHSPTLVTFAKRDNNKSGRFQKEGFICYEDGLVKKGKKGEEIVSLRTKKDITREVNIPTRQQVYHRVAKEIDHKGRRITKMFKYYP